MGKIAALASATAALLVAAPAGAMTVLLVAPDDRCGVSGCFESGRSFTHTFAADGFEGPVSIRSLKLDRRVLGAMQNQVFRVSFQRTDGTVVGDWGSFMIAVLDGDVVTLRGSAFDWTAAGSDLVLKLDLVLFEPGGGGGGHAGLGNWDDFPDRELAPGLAEHEPKADPKNKKPKKHAEGPGDDDGPGLPAVPPGLEETPGVIDPGAPGVVIVPEPQAWALMILGFGGAGLMVRKRRRGAVVAPQPYR